MNFRFMTLYRFLLLLIDGTFITERKPGKFCIGVPFHNPSIYLCQAICMHVFNILGDKNSGASHQM